MTTAKVHLEDLSTENVCLPADVAHMLKSEAKKNRLSIPELLMQWLEDQADTREASKRLKALQSGKTKAIPAAQVYKELGI